MTAETLASPTAHTPPPSHARPASQEARLGLARRRILQVNAAIGGASGVVLVAGAGRLVPLFGLGQYAAAAPSLVVMGGGLALFAAYLAWVARRPVAVATMLRFGAIDALWVVGSAALLVARALPLSAAGYWTVVVQADVVAVLAACEWYAWWRGRSAASV